MRYFRPPFGFRQKLALSIAVAALLTACIEGALDIFFDAQIDRFQAENTDVLSQETAVIAFYLEFQGDRVSLGEPALARLEPDTRFRILRGEQVVLTGPEPFPVDSAAWAVREGFVEGNYRLEIARPTGPAERLLLSELFLDLLDLPLFFLLALLVAWSLTRFTLRPVRELTLASRAMAQQHFPEPIRVPPGNDELSDMAQSFNLMQTSIRKLLERERAFTRYASHELRTPISAFKVQLEALELELKPVEEVVPVLERHVVRMEGALAALLALSRTQERDTTTTRLKPLLRDLIQTFSADAQERIRLEGTLAEEVRVADGRMVLQAVRNLLENALRYSQREVVFTTEVVGRDVHFTVRDFGPGVDESTLGKLTQPFYRSSKHRDSLGLGLALVESIVNALGGSLALRNALPGLEATLVLPVRSEEV